MKLWTKKTMRAVSAAVFITVAAGTWIAAWICPAAKEASAGINRREYYAVLEGDRICVYDRREDEVILFSETDASYLLPEDRKLLETGVELETMEEALSLIEDFGS